MVASVLEVVQGQLPVATSSTVAITTELIPSDTVICVTNFPGNLSGAVTPSGLGTWSGDVNGRVNTTNDYGYRLHYMSGATGAGNITMTLPAASLTPQYVILVVRGLEVPALDMYQVGFSSGTVPVRRVPSRAGSIVLNITHMASGTPVNPASASPSTGWVLDRNTSGSYGISVAHNLITADQVVETTTTGNLYALGTTTGIYSFGTPVEARVWGETSDVLYGGTGVTAPSAVRSEYVETLSADADASPRSVRGMSADVIWKDTGSGPKITGEYAEALQQVPAGAVSETRVRSESADVIYQALPGVALRGETVDVISGVIPPAASATVYTERIDVLSPARTVMTYSETVDVIRLYRPGSDGSFTGWGIPFTG